MCVCNVYKAAFMNGRVSTLTLTAGRLAGQSRSGNEGIRMHANPNLTSFGKSKTELWAHTKENPACMQKAGATTQTRARPRHTRLALERACALQTHTPGSSIRRTRLALERREERGERACAPQAHTPGYRESVRAPGSHAWLEAVRVPEAHAWL